MLYWGYIGIVFPYSLLRTSNENHQAELTSFLEAKPGGRDEDAI